MIFSPDTVKNLNTLLNRRKILQSQQLPLVPIEVTLRHFRHAYQVSQLLPLVFTLCLQVTIHVSVLYDPLWVEFSHSIQVCAGFDWTSWLQIADEDPMWWERNQYKFYLKPRQIHLVLGKT